MYNCYRGKKVLITGHTGFKGSWLTLWLLRAGAEVVGYALNPVTSNDLFPLLNIKRSIRDYRADVRDLEKLSSVISEEKPDFIFHLAAQALVLDGFKQPHYTFETNTQGTANILECHRKSDSSQVLILITTDKVYRNREWLWGYREIDELGGDDPYSASKAAAELIIRAYQKSFFPEAGKLIASVRAGNVLGGGDWAENRIVPDCIRALENDREIVIRNPSATRPWQHVLEPLSGYLKLGKELLNGKTEFSKPWNFGPMYSNVVTVETLVKTVVNEYGGGSYKVCSNRNSPKEKHFLSLDISQARNELNWTPLMNLGATVKLTVDWYKQYQISNVQKLCENQISEYEGICTSLKES